MPGRYVQEFSEFDYVLQMLASSCLEAKSREKSDSGGIVFLLGAGCSRQYGLPNFNDLLTYIWDDCFHEPADSLGSFQILRDRLEKYWQAQGPEARHAILHRHLGKEKTTCPGYRRLANLARKGYVKAIVNMNFDTLLEDELESEMGFERFKISTSFQAASELGSDEFLMVYKPHGTVGPLRAKAELDDLVRVARDVERIARESAQFARELIQQMYAHLNNIKADLSWTPQEIIDAASELIEAVKKMADWVEKDGAKSADLLGEIEKTQRKVTQARRNPLWAKNDLILDIANSDLFAEPDEQKAAYKLLTQHHVVSVGYSGVDAKIAAALRAFEGRDPRDRKLYFVNLVRPDPRILLVMADRASQDLCISGEDAAFENFMEHLELKLSARQPEAEGYSERRPQERRLNLMTRDERLALTECLRLAQNIRAAINVGDRGSRSIREHGDAVFDIAMRLAEVAGISLNSPEKYLLYCTAYLHDLGYFAAYSLGSAISGVRLLQTHGRMTADLLRQRLQDDTGLAVRIMPASYLPEGVGSKELAAERARHLCERLVGLCWHHASYSYEKGDETSDLEVEVRGVPLRVRFRLLHALFSASEHIVKEHPFLPSSDPVVAKEESACAVEDPVLDLYLRRRENEAVYFLQRKRVKALFTPREEDNPKSASPQARWLLSMASAFIKRYSNEAIKCGGWGVEFDCPYALNLAEGKRDRYLFRGQLEIALEEELSDRLEEARQVAVTEMSEILDRARGVLSALDREFEKHREQQTQGGALSTDLKLFIALLSAWVEAILADVREHWIADMGESLRAALENLDQFSERRGGSLPEDLESVRESVARSLGYYKENAPRASIHAEVNTLEAAQRIVGWIQQNEQVPEAMKEYFQSFLDLIDLFRRSVDECSTGELQGILDLLAIYTLRLHEGGRKERPEPRVGFLCPSVNNAMERLRRARKGSQQVLLHAYFERKRNGGTVDILTGNFLRCFETIIHPAWRFFARHWHDRSEALLMARACLDLGSSRYRSELVGGLKHLLAEKVEWNRKKGLAFAHDECTLCSSRLLYVFSHAKRLFSQNELAKFTRFDTGKSLDDTVLGLINFLLSRTDPDDPAWWGLGTDKRPNQGVRSADYLAWAARAVAFCKLVDWEIYERTGNAWLDGRVDSERFKRLLQQRLDRLFVVSVDDLLSAHSEEPHSFTLGRVALAYLDLLQMDHVRDLFIDESGRAVASFREAMSGAYESVWRVNLAQMSRFYLLPVKLVLDSGMQDERERAKSARELVELCSMCMESRIWIRKGPDAGSWGFNVKNTQAIVSALAAFWRYALEPGNEERFRQAFADAAPRKAGKANGSHPARRRPKSGSSLISPDKRRSRLPGGMPPTVLPG